MSVGLEHVVGFSIHILIRSRPTIEMRGITVLGLQFAGAIILFSMYILLKRQYNNLNFVGVIIVVQSLCAKLYAL